MNSLALAAAATWAAVLAAGALRSRQTSPVVTVGGFERAMNALETEPYSAGRQPAARSAQPPLVRRREDPMTVLRRNRFIRLCVLAPLSIVAAIWLGGAMWMLALLVVGVTAGYATVMRRLKIQRDEARSVVRELHLRPPDLQVVAGGHAAAVGGGQGQDWASTTVRLRRWDG